MYLNLLYLQVSVQWKTRSSFKKIISYPFINICLEQFIININRHPSQIKMNDQRYVFIVEWFDSAAALVRSYNLTYYAQDSSIDMFDVKNKRVFLKRCEYPSVKLNDIFIGATLNIYSRQLKVIDFADQFTRGKFQKQKGKTLAIIKPDAYMSMGKIINIIEQSGFTISNIRMLKLNEQEAQKFYSDHKEKPYFKNIAVHLSFDLIVAMELVHDNCVNNFLGIIGPANSQVGKKDNPKSLRAIFGQDQIKNAIHGSQTSSSSGKQLDFFFSSSSSFKSTAYFNSCSCLIIKPHIISEGYVGQVLDMILTGGFQISAMQMFWLDRPSAQEFLQIYKGVLPQYSQIVQQFTNGPCIALQIRQNNVVPALRELCGPSDPEMARTMRPKSIRSIYGKDKAKNAVHCTDLIQDALIQVEYFFNILQK